MEFCLAYLVMWMASASFFHNDDSNYHGGHQCHSSKWQGHVDRATATNIVIFNISYWITLKLKKQISSFAVTRWMSRSVQQSSKYFDISYFEWDFTHWTMYEKKGWYALHNHHVFLVLIITQRIYEGFGSTAVLSI